MVERSGCGSGGCVTCPFSYNDQADQAQNYGCLPDKFDIIGMKEKSGHNWACHSDETVLCGGFARYLMEERLDLDVKAGGLISYDDWANEGEMAAIVKAFNRQIEQLKNELQTEKGMREMTVNQSLSGYALYMIEAVREKLGYDADDDSHDEEVLAYFQRGEKLSKSKHLKQDDTI